jgi:integrase
MSMLFKDLVATWLDTVASVELKASGFKSYEAICRNHWVPELGDLVLDEVTSAKVQSCVAARVKSGLSARTVTNHVHVLRRLMKYAVSNGLIEVNPLTSVSVPRQEPDSTRVRYLTPDQLQRLIDQGTSPAWRVLIATAALTGLRKGEQLALRFTDLDFEHRTISVSKTLQRDGSVTSPKTPWSIGTIPMPESLVPLLEERRRKVADPDGYVFCRKDGSPLPSHVPNAVLAKALEAAGLPSVTWHEMGRHSWVVAHLQANTDIPTLTGLGRWKTSDVLLSVYAHLLPTSGSDAAQRVDELVNSKS